MALTADFLDAVAAAAEWLPGPRTVPWPTPGNLGGFVQFDSFAQWQSVLLGFRLPAGVPLNMVDGFDRALKLYLLAWLDFDVITAGELAHLIHRIAGIRWRAWDCRRTGGGDSFGPDLASNQCRE